MNGWLVTNEAAQPAELKALHKAIKKVEDDTERYSFNTAVSAFMVCVNELSELRCHKREILEPLVVLLAAYAPHLCEELYAALGNSASVLDASYPHYLASHTAEAEKQYPVSVNGKLRTTLMLPAEVNAEEAEQAALANEVVQKWVEGKPIKKFVFVPGRMINLVV